VVLGVNMLIMWIKIHSNKTTLKKKYKLQGTQKEVQVPWYTEVYESVNKAELVILGWTFFECLVSETTQEWIFKFVTGN
jgi:hypothetical protein